MRNYTLIIFLGLLTACSVTPKYAKPDNTLLEELDCDSIDKFIKETSYRLSDLQTQDNKAILENRVNATRTAVSGLLNPFMLANGLLNNKRTGDLDDTIKQYEERLAILKKAQAERCQSQETTNIENTLIKEGE